MQSLSWAQNRGQGYWRGHEIFPIQRTHPVFCGKGLQPCPFGATAGACSHSLHNWSEGCARILSGK